MEQSLFNLASTSHPHAPCVGLLAFMHPDAARHHVSGLVYRHRAVLWVCVCVCVCVRERRKHVCIMDEFVSTMFLLHSETVLCPCTLTWAPYLWPKIRSRHPGQWFSAEVGERAAKWMWSGLTYIIKHWQTNRGFLGQSALEKQNKQAPDWNKTLSLRLRAALWAKRWRQHDNMLRMEMITSSLVDVGPVTIVDLIWEQISYETIKMAAGKKKTALCR